MSLAKSGRARLALALPRHRDKLRVVDDRRLQVLFELYALVSMAIDNLWRGGPFPEEAMREYKSLSSDIREEVVRLLEYETTGLE